MANIEKRGKDSYRLTVELGYDSRGKRIRRRKTVKASGIREARKLAAQFRVEVESGEYISPEKLTVSQFTSDWQKNTP